MEDTSRRRNSRPRDANGIDAKPTRLSRRDRRRQLLDVARRVVVDRGASAMTMELLAEAAGVSKALPYAHFENIDAVLVAVYQREGVRLGRHIWSRLEDAEPDADMVRLHVCAYFEGMARSGEVFGALTVPGLSVSTKADPRNDGPKFSTRVLRTFHGLDDDRARIVGPVVNASVTALGDAWCRGAADRDECAALAEHQIRAALAWDGGG